LLSWHQCNPIVNTSLTQNKTMQTRKIIETEYKPVHY